MHKHIFYFQVLGNYSGLSTYHMSSQKGKPRKIFQIHLKFTLLRYWHWYNETKNVNILSFCIKNLIIIGFKLKNKVTSSNFQLKNAYADKLVNTAKLCQINKSFSNLLHPPNKRESVREIVSRKKGLGGKNDFPILESPQVDRETILKFLNSRNCWEITFLKAFPRQKSDRE